MKLFKIYFLLLFLVGFSHASSLNIALISDGFNENLSQKIIRETNKLFNYEQIITFSKHKVNNKESFDELYKTLEKDKSIDVIMGVGYKNSGYLISQKSFSKPSIAVGFTYWKIQKRADSKNLSVIDYSSFSIDLDFISENFSEDKRVTLVSDFIENRDKNTFKISQKNAYKDFDFVYVSTLTGSSEEEKENLFKYLNDKNIKSFYEGDVSSLKNKPLFSKSQKDMTKTSRAIALLLYQVFVENEKLENYIKVYSNEQVLFHSSTASKIEFYPSFDLLTKVIKKDELLSKIKKMSLKDALKLVLENSYDYKIANNTLYLYNEDIKNAKSAYRPDIYVDTSYSKIDADRASFNNGEKTLTAGITLSQLLYSNSALKNINIQEYVYDSQENEKKLVKQAVLYDVILNYLNTLNYQKNYEIVKDKINFIKQNLILAKNRLEVGTSDKSDIYRWESELANVNLDLVSARKNYNSSKIELSNLLQLPSRENISLQEYSIDNDLFKLFGKTPATLVSNPYDLEKVSKFLSEDLILNHDTLKTYENLIKAKKEELQMNKDSKYSPSVYLNANINNTLNRRGKGADVVNAWDDTSYKFGIDIKIPLYESGKKNISIEKSRLELINLQHKLQNEKSQIQKNIFQTMQSISSSFDSIKFSNLAYKSAQQNYILIQDKYAKGKSNIVTLLDAQNSMIIANKQKNNSVYVYLSDLSTMFYTVGYIEILNDKNKKEEMQIKLKEVL